MAKDFVESEHVLQLMRPTYRKLTIMWSVYFMIKAAVKVFGLMNWSFEQLYTINWILGTPISALLMFYSFTYPNRVYDKRHRVESKVANSSKSA